MSVRADASDAGRRPGGTLIDSVRASSLTVDVAIVSGVALVLGLIRLGTPALWYDEAYTFRQINRSYIEQFEGYQPFYYWIQKPWTSVVGNVGVGDAVPVRRRRDAGVRAAGGAGQEALRSPDRAGERALPRDQPLLRQVVPAGAGLPAARRRGSRRHAPPPSRARARNRARAGPCTGSRTRACSSRTRSSVSCSSRPTRCSSRSGGRAVLPHGLLAGVVIVGIGVPWVAQLAMRTDSETSETAWIPFPSAEAATRALVEVSGVAGLGVLLAAIGLWALRRAGNDRARGVARDVGVRAIRARARHLAREADLPRPLPRDRDARVRDARGGRGHESRRSAAGRRRGGGGRRHGRRARGVVFVGRGRQLAGRGLAKRRRDRHGTRRRGRRGRRRALVGARCGRVLRRRPDDVSTADSIWVLRWSEEGSALPADVRRPLGFGEHVLVERDRSSAGG